jgi:hypothetical protein
MTRTGKIEIGELSARDDGNVISETGNPTAAETDKGGRRMQRFRVTNCDRIFVAVPPHSVAFRLFVLDSRFSIPN